MKFDWHPPKAVINLRKHGVSFEDAIPVFFDPYRVEVLDEREDYGEERWLTVGYNGEALLSVVYTLRGHDLQTHRLISARKADPYEKVEYRNVYR